MGVPNVVGNRPPPLVDLDTHPDRILCCGRIPLIPFINEIRVNHLEGITEPIPEPRKATEEYFTVNPKGCQHKTLELPPTRLSIRTTGITMAPALEPLLQHVVEFSFEITLGGFDLGLQLRHPPPADDIVLERGHQPVEQPIVPVHLAAATAERPEISLELLVSTQDARHPVFG